MLSRIVCVAAFSAAGVWNAYAADLPVARPAAVVAPVLVWTGCYVGVHGGGGVIGGGGGGAIAGGQIGCNYQTGRLVFGLEAEGFWSSLEDTTGEARRHYSAVQPSPPPTVTSGMLIWLSGWDSRRSISSWFMESSVSPSAASN